MVFRPDNLTSCRVQWARHLFSEERQVGESKYVIFVFGLTGGVDEQDLAFRAQESGVEYGGKFAVQQVADTHESAVIWYELTEDGICKKTTEPCKII